MLHRFLDSSASGASLSTVPGPCRKTPLQERLLLVTTWTGAGGAEEGVGECSDACRARPPTDRGRLAAEALIAIASSVTHATVVVCMCFRRTHA